MAVKSDAEVIIGGKIYTLSGYEDVEYLQKVASYINRKISEVKALAGYTSLTNDMKAVLVNINLADDYFKAKDNADNANMQIVDKDKEVYEAKHDLVSEKMHLSDLKKQLDDAKESEEKLKAQLADLTKKYEELSKIKKEMELALEDSLLGKANKGKDNKGSN